MEIHIKDIMWRMATRQTATLYNFDERRCVTGLVEKIERLQGTQYKLSMVSMDGRDKWDQVITTNPW